MTPPRLAAITLVLLACGSPVAAQEGASATDSGFRLVRIEGMSTVRALQKAHGPEGFRTILHLNRRDLARVREGAQLVVPDRPRTIAEVSPFPAVLGAEAWLPPRLLLVSQRIQAFAAYESGRRVRWGAVSTGRRDTPTPAGLFAANWRSKLRRSSVNQEWLLPWYVNFINASGVSFHEYALPGYPASHACVRLLEDDARWIYDWVDLWQLSANGQVILRYGTPILVFGDYAYDQPGPWMRLVDDPEATTIGRDEILRALEPHRVLLAERSAPPPPA